MISHNNNGIACMLQAANQLIYLESIGELPLILNKLRETRFPKVIYYVHPIAIL